MNAQKDCPSIFRNAQNRTLRSFVCATMDSPKAPPAEKVAEESDEEVPDSPRTVFREMEEERLEKERNKKALAEADAAIAAAAEADLKKIAAAYHDLKSDTDDLRRAHSNSSTDSYGIRLPPKGSPPDARSAKRWESEKIAYEFVRKKQEDRQTFSKLDFQKHQQDMGASHTVVWVDKYIKDSGLSHSLSAVKKGPGRPPRVFHSPKAVYDPPDTRDLYEEDAIGIAREKAKAHKLKTAKYESLKKQADKVIENYHEKVADTEREFERTFDDKVKQYMTLLRTKHEEKLVRLENKMEEKLEEINLRIKLAAKKEDGSTDEDVVQKYRQKIQDLDEKSRKIDSQHGYRE